MTGQSATPLLSRRDAEALALLGAGLSTAEIAAAMSLSPNTVRTHVRRLLAKLEAEDRRQIVPRAREVGLL